MGLFDRFKKSAAPPHDGPVLTVEAVRRHAIQRLIGTVVLVAGGVVLFAWMFDRQPRPVAIDIPIDIPDKKTVPPLVLPKAPAPAALPPPAPAAIKPTVEAEKSVAAGEKLVAPDAKPSAAPAVAAPAAAVVATPIAPKAGATDPIETRAKAEKQAKSAAQSPIQTQTPTPTPPPPKVDTAAKADADKARAADAARAKALLEGGGSAPNTAAAGERFIVQFGSFAHTQSAQDARRTVEKSGLKTYAQEASTPDGKRIRTRVGPFATRAEAETAATKIKALGLPANILTL